MMRNFINIVETIEKLSTISFDKLWHVGSMNAKDKRSGSYEGAGLSVSRHPNAWMRIARGFVAGDTWEFIKIGNIFLDFHNLNTSQQNTIIEWGINNGFVTKETKFRLHFFDADLDEESYFDLDTLSEIEDEIESMMLDEDEYRIETIQNSLKATPKLQQRSMGAGDGLEALTPIWVEDTTQLDGVWWRDRYDPANLSAPRGVIVPRKIKEWSIQKVTTVDDETE